MNSEQKGYLYNFGHNIFWGIFPIISIIAFTKLPSVYVASLSSAIAAIFFFFLTWKEKSFSSFKNNEAIKYTLLASFTIGVLFYGLVFYGMSMTSAGNAGIILLMEIFFTFIVLNLMKAEKSTLNQVLGAILMIIGALIIVFPGELHVNSGDLILLIATMVPPLGNHWMKKARKLTSSSFIMFVRSTLSAIILFAMASLFYAVPELKNIAAVLWALIINGVFIMGIGKIFWIEGIHRIPITVSISLTTISPLLTLLFAFLILGEIPTVWQISAVLPMIFGVLILMKKSSK